MKRIFLGLLLIVLLVPSAFDPVPASTVRKDKVILWTRYLGIDEGFGAPITDSQSVYVANSTSVLCYGIDSGELLWKREFEKPPKDFFSKIYLSLHKKYALFGNSKGLVCLDKLNGKTIWENHEPLTSNVEVLGDVAYSAFKKTVCKIDVKTGKVLQRKEFETKDDYSFITIAGLNRLFIATTKGMKKMVNIETGKVVWENDSLVRLILDKPIVSGKYVVVSGYDMNFERLMFLDLETGKVGKSLYHYNAQIDASDGRVLTSEYCIDTYTLEPIWSLMLGWTRFYDCFDAIAFNDYDSFSITDWNGNTVATKKPDPKLKQYPSDRCSLKPASSDGRYFLTTEMGYLISYANKPETITYNIGDDHISAVGKRVSLEHKPYRNDKGELVVDPIGFLEPLGWVSSHNEPLIDTFIVFHDYKRNIGIVKPDHVTTLLLKKKLIGHEGVNGGIVIPFDTMVSEFGLTMTKDGDRINLSYQSK